MSQDDTQKLILLRESSFEENVTHSISLSINGKLSILMVVESLLGFDSMLEISRGKQSLFSMRILQPNSNIGHVEAFSKKLQVCDFIFCMMKFGPSVAWNSLTCDSRISLSLCFHSTYIQNSTYYVFSETHVGHNKIKSCHIH